MSTATTPVSRARPLLGVAGLGLLLLVLAFQVMQPSTLRSLGLGDYIAYWSAGRVQAQGGNPYAPEQLLPLQQREGWPEDWPNIMYYPPWALPLVMPFGLFSFWTSRLAWLGFHLGILLFAADWAWRCFGGPLSRRWVACLLTMTFVPSLIVLRMGQIGPLLLLGVVAFLNWQRQRKDMLAGAALLLAAIKPQLVYLFGVAVLFWAIDHRRWRILIGGVTAAVALLAVALARNPLVLEQYRFALANPPSGNITPTTGALLRLAFGEERTWLQFVPTAAGLVWFVLYWKRQRWGWKWEQQASLLLLVSFLTTSYGAWIFDVVVLLVPTIQAAAWLARANRRRLSVPAIVGFVGINALILAMNLRGASYPSFIWVTPTLLLGYQVLRRQLRSDSMGLATN